MPKDLQNLCRTFLVLFLTLFLSFSVAPVKAQLNMIETKELSLVTYDFGHKFILPHAGRCFHNALEFHRKLFDYEPSERITVLIQDFGDYGNGGATAIPKNAISMGLAPFSYTFETSPAGERVFSMMNHELVHVVALDNFSRADLFYHKLFMGKVKPTNDDPVSMFYSFLTSPRRYSPRWYHEGIASYVETWMSGGVGLAQGNYDEMVFRTRVLEEAHIYTALGLESEGTTTDFQGKSNSYLYGTRFMGYLAYVYGPDRIIEWVKRKDGSKRFFAGQFKNVFGKSLQKGWDEWIVFERDFQKKNIEGLQEFPITEVQLITEKVLGSVSYAHHDKQRNKIYVAINYPGQVPHLASMDLATGKIKKLTDIKGAALFYVTSLTYDRDGDKLFYTTDNDRWRDLNSYDLKTGKSIRLQKDVRTGDLAFNPVDKSIWGIKHLNGISTIVRIPRDDPDNPESTPYDSWELVHRLDYGTDIFDIDISPDGSLLSAAVTDLRGHQSLMIYDVQSLMDGNAKVDEVADFEVSSPQSFRFTEDGEYLFGSSYVSGVSNIFRVEVSNYEIKPMSNALTGLFRPVRLSDEQLFAFKFSSDGFQPVLLKNEVVTSINSIEYLGNLAFKKHAMLQDWELDIASPEQIDIESMTINEGQYKPGKELNVNYAYPTITGYKDFIGIGYKMNISDPLSFREWDLAFSFTPKSWKNGITREAGDTTELENDEVLHFSLYGKAGRYSWDVSYNGTDFYDLFGPTQTSRKGIRAGLDYNQSLVWDPPKKLDLSLGLGGFYGLEGSPEFQKLETQGAENDFYLTANGSLVYSYIQNSLGAVDYEKGFKTSVRLSNAFSSGSLFPVAVGTMDLGFQLPINHFSIWLRTAAGNSFSDDVNPFSRFGFAAFGNNYVDHRATRRFRGPFAFPGLSFSADRTIIAKGFAKGMVEAVLPPIRFKRLGVLNLYSNWIQATVFSSGLVFGNDTGSSTTFVNVGSQIDMRIVLFSLLSTTFSVGYAQAFDVDDRNTTYDEWMVSFKLFR